MVYVTAMSIPAVVILAVIAQNEGNRKSFRLYAEAHGSHQAL